MFYYDKSMTVRFFDGLGLLIDSPIWKIALGICAVACLPLIGH